MGRVHGGPISLPSDGEEYPSGTDCTVSGWGTTSEGGSLGQVLMKVTVPVVSDDDCRGAYGQDDIADSMICAGLDAGGKDSCREIPVDPSCADPSCPELCLGGTDALSQDSPESTLRPLTSSAG